MVEPDIYNSIKSRIRNRKPKRFFDEDDDEDPSPGKESKEHPLENGFVDDGKAYALLITHVMMNPGFL